MTGPSRAPSRPAAQPAPPLDAARVAELHTRLLSWYAANGRELPWRRTRDPYAVLVSEVMLQQTQVPRVVPAFEAFLHAYPTLERLAEAALADVLRHWRGLGYNNRAERLWRCARLCVARCRDDRAAELPATFEELVALPGVGQYTARAVMVFAHDADLAAVDANVRRVLSHELELPDDLPDGALQAVADEVLPRGRSRDWHNALMDYGSLVLTSRATGIAPRTRQGAFEGSRRWFRSRMLRSLLDDGPQTPGELATRLAVDVALVDELAAALERDGLLRIDDGRVTVA